MTTVEAVRTAIEILQCVNADWFLGYPPGTIRVVQAIRDDLTLVRLNYECEPYGFDFMFGARKPFPTDELFAWKRVDGPSASGCRAIRERCGILDEDPPVFVAPVCR